MIVMELPEENINSCLHERATEDNHSRNVVLRVKLKADNEDGGRLNQQMRRWKIVKRKQEELNIRWITFRHNQKQRGDE